MVTKNIIISILVAVIYSMTALVVSYWVLGRVDGYIEQKGIYECGLIARSTYTNAEGAEITQPYPPAYNQCLEEKGIIK
jgi:hypothetical protein